jgi:alpha-amylase
MPKICLYLQLHQPWRLGEFNVFDVGNENSYFIDDKDANGAVLKKVAQKSYLPMLRLLKKLLKTEEKFCCTLSLSGVFVEQALEYQPEIISLVKEIVATGKVELLAETYYHSLAALYSPEEFKVQVWRHSQLMKKLFNFTPTVFRNTELIYSNNIAEQVAALGFSGMLTEAVGRYLWDRPKTQVYYSYSPARLPLLLKHAQLSDDVAFRFSDRNWDLYPLTVERYLEWTEVYGEDEIINLFMDFETFGEHQWKDTGIFEFFAEFVHQFAERSWNSFVTPRQVFAAEKIKRTYANKWSKKPAEIPDHLLYDVPEPISWADVDRDLTAWRGNSFQWDTLEKIYELQKTMYALKDEAVLDDWRRLQTSDHFYYMCTKWAADGDVHAYFSPYKSPFEAYRRYSVVLADLVGRTL